MLKHLPNCSLILTTHRMDEAESLCDKITIMINGRFVVFGSPGHLKSTYGQGYSVNFKVETPRVSDLEEYITSNLPYLIQKDKIELEEFSDGTRIVQLMYSVKNEVKLDQIGGLSSIFLSVCKMKSIEKNIIDFEVTRSSLEQVFIEFAKHQIEQQAENK
jgi:ABC-type multidrug transport system ATPase subunit